MSKVVSYLKFPCSNSAGRVSAGNEYRYQHSCAGFLRSSTAGPRVSSPASAAPGAGAGETSPSVGNRRVALPVRREEQV